MPRTDLLGISFERDVCYESWKDLGVSISRHSSASCWWLGDWTVYGQGQYGERYKQAILETGLEYRSRRRPDVPFQHHAEVCALPDRDQDFWLDVAVQNRWPRSELRRRVRTSRPGNAGAVSTRILRLVLDVEREKHWRDAALAAGHGLEEWVVETMDRLAAENPSGGVAMPLSAVQGARGSRGASGTAGIGGGRRASGRRRTVRPRA
jgi:hypothetical protein